MYRVESRLYSRLEDAIAYAAFLFKVSGIIVAVTQEPA